VRGLWFHGVAAHPGVAAALLRRAEHALRPFQRYLEQAIQTARQRQTRHVVRWEPVRVQHRLRLTPLDTRIAVPRPEPGWLVRGWPGDRRPDPTKPLMVVSRDATIRIEACEPTPAGELRIRTEDPLYEDDQVFWCGRPCQLVRETSPAPPAELRVRDQLHPVHLVAQDEDTWFLVCPVPPPDLAGVDGLAGPGQGAVCAPFDGLRQIVDEHGLRIPCSGELVHVPALPAPGPVRGDDGVRYRWAETAGNRRRGLWIQLLPAADASADAVVDLRAAFCEDGVAEVWTEPRRPRHKHDAIRVRSFDRDQYQLQVDRLPPADTQLYLPLDVRNLRLQRRALDQLAEAPLPHHQGLLRLCEEHGRARWPRLAPSEPDQWFVLEDAARDGTAEQRAFVCHALGSRDFTLLEGPPGSGKTTAICELILQLRARGQRVLLCASTHVAVDNVLERLLDRDDPIDAVRVGRIERVDDRVKDAQLDRRVESLVASWRHLGAFAGHTELEPMAERAVIMAAELTCGTTMGIVNHPVFRGQSAGARPREQPVTTYPHWDVLIIDEASKTTVQELMVPALMARRWVIVGDVRQLPPFAERDDIVANLQCLTDPRGAEIFPVAHQRACLLLWYLGRRELDPIQRAPVRRLIAEPAAVLDRLEAELAARERAQDVVRVVATTAQRTQDRAIRRVTVDELRRGDPAALRVAAADWVLVADDILADVSSRLPAGLLTTRLPDALSPEDAPRRFRHAHWLARAGRFPEPVRTRDRRRGDIARPSELEEAEAAWLAQSSWATEVAWRTMRVHELRRSRRAHERTRYMDEITALLPATANVRDAIDDIRDIGLPGVMEVLQDGLGQALGRRRDQRASALTHGMTPDTRADRLVSLGFQHRMHPDISAFPRDLFYDGKALRDASTVHGRDGEIGWEFARDLPARRVWLDVQGHDAGGVNQAEVDRMQAVLRHFLAWAAHGPPRRSRPARWEVACLCFYVKQELAIRDMLRRLTGDDRQTRFEAPHVEIVCGTVDRFQGREADLVLLSLRNTGRVGFLDSVSRLNVALTRARHQLVILGNAGYFGGPRCKTVELSALATQTSRIDGRHWPTGRPTP
jgi:hypothetical protein